MFNIIGVKFRNISKVYYFDPRDLKVRYHDHVIVETARGLEYGTVVMSPTKVTDDKVVLPLKEVIRLATPDDTERDRVNREKEKEAYRICKQKIAEHNLDMKLIEAEYAFDNSKILFYFTADGRIDFRELVKDLAGIFRTRIELRQIGVRDETKILGGIGICGRPLCCHTYLGEFAPVSIKMAKEQNLSLNPTKISGTCGRLMCCLKNESDTYCCLNKNLPGKGDYVTTPEGDHGEVQAVNILRQTVKVVVDLENDEKEIRDYPVEEISFISKKKRAAQLKAEHSENEHTAQEKPNHGRREEKKEQEGREPRRRRDGRPNHRSGEEHAEQNREQNDRRKPEQGQSDHRRAEHGRNGQKKSHAEGAKGDTANTESAKSEGVKSENRNEGQGGENRQNRRPRRRYNKPKRETANDTQG